MPSKKKNSPSALGFCTRGGGVHTARTLMLAELSALLDAVPDPAPTRGDYRKAVVEENCLGKATGRNRQITFAHLATLYALDPEVLLFRALLHFWRQDPPGRALLALLCAYARDPLLRQSAPVILSLREGERITSADMAAFFARKHPGRFSAATLSSLAQNVDSSWTQSGHLRGTVRKVRIRPAATPGAAAYALLLGHLRGARGPRLFSTEYFQLLDVPPEAGMELAQEAANRGLLLFYRLADVMEVRFPHLLEGAVP